MFSAKRFTTAGTEDTEEAQRNDSILCVISVSSVPLW